MTTKQTWVEIGTIGVDAGLCWIGDPCYVVAKDCSNVWEKWHDFCDDLRKGYPPNQAPPIKQFNYALGHAGLGVCVNTGYGDGSYPVYARFGDEGRVAEVRVVFMDEDSSDDNLLDPDVT